MTRVLSCGVLVTDGLSLLIGHATGTSRWDIPKGQMEPGESAVDAACRELVEETGLEVGAGALAPLGRFSYLPAKDLMLYLWRRDTMPAVASLHCRSTFSLRGRDVPEFDRFDCPPWAEAMSRLGASMQRVLAGVTME